MVELSSLGATVNSYDSSLINNATFNADLNGVAAGTVVFNSSDSTLLGKVQADLSSSVPSGLSLQVSGTVLSVEVQSAYNFTASGSILDASGWGGSVPPANVDVAIDGAGVVATLSSGAFPAWNSIEVKNGATLRISTNATLPPITLNKSARLEITNDAVVTVANVSDLAGIATAQQLPVLEIATNSTISVPSGMKFKNVDMRLYGTVTKASNSDASPVFGYAESGETTYFALTADGATFDFHSDIAVDPYTYGEPSASISIVCPSVGGTVIPVGTIVLRNSVRTVKGWNDFGDWEFGSNNPTSVPFSVLVDGTVIDCSGNFYVAGAAHLSLVNGSCIRRDKNCLGHGRDVAVRGSSTVDVGEGCNIDFTTGAGWFGIDSQSAVDAITVRDGGLYSVSYNSSGWGIGVFASDGGVLGVDVIYDTRTDPRTALLRGFASARLDGDLVIAAVTNEITSDHFVDWNRHTTMANIPFSGSGDVTITNGVPAYPFTVTMVNGANTATGTIKVNKVYGDAETMLYFANGANWAGTVVAGNVAFTNLVDAAGGAAVTFNDLRIPEGQLVVRSGDTLTIDGAVIRQAGDTGRLVVTEGQANLRSKNVDAFAYANVRTAQGRRLVLKPSKTADENGYYDFTAVVPTGITVIIR